MRDVQLRELASTRKRLEGDPSLRLADAAPAGDPPPPADECLYAEKTEVVNELLRNAEAELKMKTMAVQFAQDVLQHYDGQV
jgi:hypothetical protein